MLSLLLGSRITDAAVASIVQSYSSLELLDLSGYYFYFFFQRCVSIVKYLQKSYKSMRKYETMEFQRNIWKSANKSRGNQGETKELVTSNASVS